MKALRVGVDFYINADQIEIVQPWPSRPAMRERKAALAAGTYYDATGGRKILSVVTLRSGWVIATPLTPTRLIQRPVIAAPQRDSFKKTATVVPTIETPITVLNPETEAELFSRENTESSDTSEENEPEVFSRENTQTEPDDGEDETELFSRENTEAAAERNTPLHQRLFSRRHRG